MARRTLSLEVREGILRDLAAGVRAADIATKYGVSVPTVFNYKNRATTAAVAPVQETFETTTTAPVATRTARKSTKASR